MRIPYFLASSILFFSGLPVAAGAASFCESIENKPGLYVKDANGFPKRLTDSVKLSFQEPMKLWVVPDRPKEGVENAWHIKIETLLSEKAQKTKTVKLRRNQVKTVCSQETAPNVTNRFNDTTDAGYDVGFDDHDNFTRRKRDLRLAKWHFNWEDGDRKNSCPHTSDYVDKLTYADGTQLQVIARIDTARSGSAEAGVEKKLKFTTISSNLVHRNSDDGFCHSFTINRSVQYGPGFTLVKVKKLPNRGRFTVKIDWNN